MSMKARRILGSVLGTLIIALGISVFKESMLGTDAISGMNMVISERIGWSLGTWNLVTNACFFVPQILWGRKYIGLGTVVNGVGCGYFVDFFYSTLILPAFGTLESIPVRLLFVILGTLIIALGAALYQTADLGVAPYDYLSLGLTDGMHFPYFWCRMATDCSAAAIGALLGGIPKGRIGIGTVICSLGLGPFIYFFTKQLWRKWIPEE